ncbi:MAG: hypothetical protein WBA07_01605 [Rivularia sp. (in: cyanobacteria)]
MAKPVGGRGKQAPYQTKLMRIPLPVSAQVNELVERYRNYLETTDNVDNPPQLLDTAIKPVNEFDSVTPHKHSNGNSWAIDELKILLSKIEARESGYKANSFSQRIKDLKQIINLIDSK